MEGNRLKDAFWESYNEMYYYGKLKGKNNKIREEEFSNKDIAKAINKYIGQKIK